MDTASAPKILLVDDEQRVLEGLSMHLRRNFTVQTATSGAAGLERLTADGAIAVVVSDMRMPNMDGATFLARAREIAPTTVRMMLTGQADIDSAIAAINGGQIFRFLTKPTSPANFLAAVTAALTQHRLIVSEKVLTSNVRLLKEFERGSSGVPDLQYSLPHRDTRIRRLLHGLILEETPREAASEQGGGSSAAPCLRQNRSAPIVGCL
jgi:DNA-binding NtrC family response regulator